MIDWTKSMQQTFEFYRVDRYSWRDAEKIDEIISCSITRDLTAETLGHATFKTTRYIPECYIRVYMVVNQNEESLKCPLGTFLVQSPAHKYTGIIDEYDADAYTPLIELKEKQPPIAYTILEKKGTQKQNIMEKVCVLTAENSTAPVVPITNDAVLQYNYTANIDDSWMNYLLGLMSMANVEFALDENGTILFAPIQKLDSLAPVWIYEDNENSIFYPEIEDKRDLYNIPNAVEVIYSDAKNYYTVKIINNDPDSEISTVNRGREILYRDTNPSISGGDTASIKNQVKQYAINLLKSLSSLEHTVTYSHGFTPVQIGSCVRLNYAKAGIQNVNAKVYSQTFECVPGCKVSETAIYSTKLWDGETYELIGNIN